MSFTTRLNQQLTIAAASRQQQLERAVHALDSDLPAVRGEAEASHQVLEHMDTTLSDISQSSAATAAELGYLSAVLDEYLPQIAAELSRSRRALDSLVELTRNPARTAAEERMGWGVDNLSRDLLPEAESDFRSALENYPYDAFCHYCLGLTIAQARRDPKAAADAFSKAVRYSTKESRGLAAGAALLGAAAYRQADEPDKAEQLLRGVASNAASDCPEVWLSLARMTDSADDLAQALELQPRYVRDALADELACADEAARLAIERTFAPRLESLEEAERHLRDVAGRAGVTLPPPATPSIHGRRPVELLLETDAHVKKQMQHLKKVAEAAAHGVPLPSPPLHSPPERKRRTMPWDDSWEEVAAVCFVIAVIAGISARSWVVFGAIFVGPQLVLYMLIPGLVRFLSDTSYTQAQSRYARAAYEVDEAFRRAKQRRDTVEPAVEEAQQKVAGAKPKPPLRPFAI